MKIRDILRAKGQTLVTTTEEESLATALNKLAQHNISAMPVCDAAGTIQGMFTERDLVRHFCSHDEPPQRFKVRDCMSRDIVVGVPDDDVDYIMSVMTARQVRHLPIMQGPRLIGIISIRDLVSAQLEDKQVEVRHLQDYISGGYV